MMMNKWDCLNNSFDSLSYYIQKCADLLYEQSRVCLKACLYLVDIKLYRSGLIVELRKRGVSLRLKIVDLVTFH